MRLYDYKSRRLRHQLARADSSNSSAAPNHGFGPCCQGGRPLWQCRLETLHLFTMQRSTRDGCQNGHRAVVATPRWPPIWAGNQISALNALSLPRYQPPECNSQRCLVWHVQRTTSSVRYMLGCPRWRSAAKRTLALLHVTYRGRRRVTGLCGAHIVRLLSLNVTHARTHTKDSRPLDGICVYALSKVQKQR